MTPTIQMEIRPQDYILTVPPQKDRYEGELEKLIAETDHNAELEMRLRQRIQAGKSSGNYINYIQGQQEAFRQSLDLYRFIELQNQRGITNDNAVQNGR